MTTITHPTTQIPEVREEWFAPVKAIDQERAESDPEFRGFLEVSRHVGAWASPFESERRGWFTLSVPRTVYVPLADLLPGEADGEATALTNDGRRVEFWFKARLQRIVQGFAQYAVQVSDSEKECEAF